MVKTDPVNELDAANPADVNSDPQVVLNADSTAAIVVDGTQPQVGEAIDEQRTAVTGDTLDSAAPVAAQSLETVVPDANTNLEPGISLDNTIGDAVEVQAQPKPRPEKKKKNKKPKAPGAEGAPAPQAKPKQKPEGDKPEGERKVPKIFAEGMARITTGRNNEVRFRGLYLEGQDRSGRPRNRILMLGTNAPKWFKDYCEQHKEAGDVRVRIRIISLIGQGLAVAVPSARSQNEFEADFGREFMERANSIRSFEQCENDDQVTEFTYRRACELAKLDFGGLFKYEDGKVYAIGVDNWDTIIHLYGIENFLDFAEGIRRGATTLDKEIEYNIRYKPI